MTMTLRTQRLLLREFVESDLTAVHAFRSDEETLRFMAEACEREDQTRAWLHTTIAHNRADPRFAYNFAMVLQRTDHLIGHIGIGHADVDKREGSFGYCLHRHFWGQGLMTEALRAILAFGFEHIRLHHIFAECHPANYASARVMEKVGMRQEGYFVEKDWVDGGWWDAVHYAILDREWMVRSDVHPSDHVSVEQQ